MHDAARMRTLGESPFVLNPGRCAASGQPDAAGPSARVQVGAADRVAGKPHPLLRRGAARLDVCYAGRPGNYY